MQTILGAGGPVANALQKELEAKQQTLRLVSRRTLPANGKTTWRKADLCSYSETLNAAIGSKIIYLCAGLVYDYKIWQQQWPLIMQNVIHVAKETGARLIFFDNVYMYGLVEGPMRETTPYNPCSKKGEVRALIADQLMAESHSGNLNASIARAPDFYGTKTSNSVFDTMVLDRFSKKQKAQWLGNPNSLHSFILIRDAAKALALLGETPESDNQIWHLPTAPSLRGTEFIEMAAAAFHTKPSFTRINELMLQTLGLFNKSIKNSVEMYYQYEHDYQFDSSKFENTFRVKPTAYRTGIQEIAEMS